MNNRPPPLPDRASMPFNPIAYRKEQAFRGADKHTRKVLDLQSLLDQALRSRDAGVLKGVLLEISHSINCALSCAICAQALEFVERNPHVRIIPPEEREG